MARIKVFDTTTQSWVYADKSFGKDGKDGKDGKSAYEYAKDGGYTGTEEDFAEKLASGGMPPVTIENNGDFLRVVDGVWTAVGIPNAEEVAF